MRINPDWKHCYFRRTNDLPTTLGDPFQTADGSHLANVTDEEMQDHYDNFFEDVFVECEDKYGQVRDARNFIILGSSYLAQ